MKMTCQALLEKYQSLKRFHYKTLHELADAAQIIKSYEFLERSYKKEQHLLENIVHTAETLCETNDFGALLERREELQDAIGAYRSSRKARAMLNNASKTVN